MHIIKKNANILTFSLVVVVALLFLLLGQISKMKRVSNTNLYENDLFFKI